jgi:hypothetical protein
VGSIAIRNATELDFCGVYISLATAPDWGGNQLAEGRRIASGEQLIIEDIPFGTYDLRTEDCAVQTVDVEFAVTIDGDKAWTIEQAAVRVENDSDEAICGVYARTTDAPGVGWGNNRLDVDDLEPGAEVNIPLAQTEWDLRAVACNPDFTPAEQLATPLEGIVIWAPEFEE